VLAAFVANGLAPLRLCASLPAFFILRMKHLRLPALAFAACAAAALSAAAADPAPAAPVKVDGFTFVKTVGAVSEYTLDANGLDVLIMPEHTAPVATFMVTYHVGSRNEVIGSTGSTHLLEHLMFKGGPNYNDAKGNSVKQFLESVGGNYNATTWLDRTNYFAELGSEHLEGYLAIEADRMRNLWIRESDRQTEMTVVRNEFEIGENDPVQALDKEIFAAAYVAHPYHHSTIGWRSDIEKVPIEKLRAFYDTFYWPDNATVTLIGDFDPVHGLELVKKYYGGYPRAPHPLPQVYTEEPEQSGPRRVTVRRAGELGVVGISYKSPAGTHPDYPALTVLGTILGNGKTSRFYRALTDKSLTTNVRTAGVTDAEVATAVGKITAATAYARDGAFQVASVINEDIAVGDWSLYYTVPEAVKKVTAADVKRVAEKYFDLNKSTTGWFVPLAANPNEK